VLGLGNDLVQETIDELEALQLIKGNIADGIAFAHSGFTAPLLAAIEKMRYDVQTVIIYEGPHANYKTFFSNPNLERIIHVRGTGIITEGDAWVPFLGKAEFGGVENLNIEIEGAFHSDFSYNEAEWDAKIAAATGSTPTAVEAQKNVLREQKERNRKVNIFMRKLYQAALTDQTRRGDLRFFLENTSGIEYSALTNSATVNLNLLNL
jgi:hypothetical protein